MFTGRGEMENSPEMDYLKTINFLAPLIFVRFIFAHLTNS